MDDQAPDPDRFTRLFGHDDPPALMRERLAQRLRCDLAAARGEALKMLLDAGCEPANALRIIAVKFEQLIEQRIDRLLPSIRADLARTAPRH